MPTQKRILLILAMVCMPIAGMAQQFVGTGGKYPRKGGKVVYSVRRIDSQLNFYTAADEERWKIDTVQAPVKMEDGKYVREGYEVLLTYSKIDTQTVVDPVTGAEMWKIRQHSLYPEAVNGEKIYRYADVTKHADQRRHRQPLEDYILAKLSKRLKVLPDGSYLIKMDNVVVNKNGEIVYYELGGIVGLKNGNRYRGDLAIPPTIKLPIDNQVRAIMNNAPSMKPAKINGRRVFYLADVYLSDFRIDVKDGEPTFLFRL